MNSISWDATLLNVSIGGYSRRIDWDHHPLDLNKMKLFQCDLTECDAPERYYPTEADKHADDWVPTVPPQTEVMQKIKLKNGTGTIRKGV